MFNLKLDNESAAVLLLCLAHYDGGDKSAVKQIDGWAALSAGRKDEFIENEIQQMRAEIIENCP